MPEGPEVAVIADSLNSVLIGKQIINLSIDEKSRYSKSGLPGHQQFRDQLPLEVKSITSRGKKVIFSLTKDIYLVSSLGMEGHWIWKPTERHSNLWIDFGHIEGSLKVCQHRLFYDDSRHHGILEIIFGTDELKARLSKLGPDLLKDEVTVPMWQDQIRKKTRKHMLISNFLMKQEYFCGIGNYLRAEILYKTGYDPVTGEYKRGIPPDARLDELTDDEIKRLQECSQAELRASYSSGGHTEYTYLNPTGSPGTHPVIIYNKERCPLGHPIRREKIGSDDRTMHWCPTCQPSRE